MVDTKKKRKTAKAPTKKPKMKKKTTKKTAPKKKQKAASDVPAEPAKKPAKTRPKQKLSADDERIHEGLSRPKSSMTFWISWTLTMFRTVLMGGSEDSRLPAKLEVAHTLMIQWVIAQVNPDLQFLYDHMVVNKETTSKSSFHTHLNNQTWISERDALDRALIQTALHLKRNGITYETVRRKVTSSGPPQKIKNAFKELTEKKEKLAKAQAPKKEDAATRVPSLMDTPKKKVDLPQNAFTLGDMTVKGIVRSEGDGEISYKYKLKGERSVSLSIACDRPSTAQRAVYASDELEDGDSFGMAMEPAGIHEEAGEHIFKIASIQLKNGVDGGTLHVVDPDLIMDIVQSGYRGFRVIKGGPSKTQSKLPDQ